MIFNTIAMSGHWVWTSTDLILTFIHLSSVLISETKRIEVHCTVHTLTASVENTPTSVFHR